ncbi:hypothetical protein K492DRAFT_205217 [Lichtheimia hyalospora FSU 10163]|nr:hypothetical protein K492DRAFT_205217 [Lichtheimia hyalospora FSU 10163]
MKSRDNSMQDDQIIVTPPSPPSSSFMHHDDEKPNIDDATVIESLSSCQDDINQAQHCLKEQYRRGVLLRSFSDPAPALNKANIMDCHRLAIEALQHLYVEERRRHTNLEKEADSAKEQVVKLQQELAYQKRQHMAEKRKWQKDMTRVYEMAETVYEMSSPAQHRNRKQATASSPVELQNRLYDILANTMHLQQHPCTSLNSRADDIFPSHFL